MAYSRKWLEQLNNALEKDEAETIKIVNDYYEKESLRLQKEIDHYFSKYGEDNIVSFRTLKESLDEDDRKLLFEAWDDFADKYPEYKHLLPVRENIYKLDRMQGLEYSIKIQQLRIGAFEESELSKHLMKNALRGANKTAEQLGMGSAFYSERADIIRNFVGTNWSKAGNFSQNIWSNREKLSNTLNNDIAQAFARGDSRKKIVEQVDKRFNSGKKNADRLVYTEGTFVFNESQAKVFEQWFDYYSISVADSRACPVCRDLQARQEIEYARFDEREAGINFPPMHPWCRCTFNVQVDKNEWMKKFIATGGNPKSAGDIFKGATGVALSSVKVNRDSNSKLSKTFGTDNYNEICNMVDDCGNDNYIKAWSEYANSIEVVNESKRGYFLASDKTVHMNIKKSVLESAVHKRFGTPVHELSHAIDNAVGQKGFPVNIRTNKNVSVTNNAFRNAIQKDYDNLYEVCKKELQSVLVDHNDVDWLFRNDYISSVTYNNFYNKEVKATATVVRDYMETKLTKEIPNLYDRTAISDALQGITKGKIDLGVGHTKAYYVERPYMCEVEAFANFSSALVTNNDEIEVLKKYLPNAWKSYEDLLEEIANGIGTTP